MPNRRYVHKILIIEYSKIIFVCVTITDYIFLSAMFLTVHTIPPPPTPNLFAREWFGTSFFVCDYWFMHYK